MDGGPRQARIAYGVLLATALPYMVVVTAVNFVAVAQARATLPHTEPWDVTSDIPLALREFSHFAYWRIAWIALMFLGAAIVSAAIAWAVRRGAARRPSAVLIIAGCYASSYLVALFATFWLNPVTGFEGHSWEDARGWHGSPWDMWEASPDWYLPVLVALFVLAAVTAVTAVSLLTRRAVAQWLAGRPFDSPSAVSSSSGATPVAVASIAAALYLAVNSAAIWVAELWPGPTGLMDQPWTPETLERLTRAAAGTRIVTLHVTGVLAAFAVPLAILGIWMRRKGARPIPLVATGLLSVPYLLTFGVLTVINPMSMRPDDESGLTNEIPGWHWPALLTLLVLAVLTHLLALVRLARAPYDFPIGSTLIARPELTR